MVEKSFIMIKPDGVRRNLIGEIIKRVEQKGYKIIAMKLLRLTEEMAAKHYQEHVGKDFYQGLLEFITSGPVVAMVVEGENAVKGLRQIIGNTNPLEATAGSIRGDFGQISCQNIIHGADSVESAEREMKIYFKDEDFTTRN